MAKKKSGRRDNKTGAIYKDGNGYRVAILVGKDAATGKPIYRKERAKTHEEAVEALTRLQAAQHAGKISVVRGMAFGAYLDAWLGTIKANRSDATHRQYSSLVETHIKPNLGKKPIDKVARKDVQALLTAKATQKVAPRDKAKENVRDQTLSLNTLRLIRAVIHSAYQDAMRDQLATHNPAEFCELPNVATQREKLKWLNEDQAKALLEQLEQSEFGALFVFLLFTGTRLGEATGVRWEDINLGEEPQVNIRGKLQRIDGKLTYKSATKTNRNRAIPLSDPLPKLLEDLKLSAFINGTSDPDGIVFLNPEGRRIDPKYAWTKLQELCLKAKLPAISPHTLRHTCASFLLAHTGDIHAVSKIVGHAQISMTANTYAHSDANTLRPVMNHMSKLKASKQDKNASA